MQSHCCNNETCERNRQKSHLDDVLHDFYVYELHQTIFAYRNVMYELLASLKSAQNIRPPPSCLHVAKRLQVVPKFGSPIMAIQYRSDFICEKNILKIELYVFLCLSHHGFV